MSQKFEIKNKNKKREILRSYFELCKPNVMYLAILSSLTGMFLAPGNISFFEGFFAIILISLGAGSAGAFNMYFEMEIDSMIERTSKRPLPSLKLRRKNALYFAIFLCFFSVSLLWAVSNFLSAFLLLFTIAFYAFLYTLVLKKRTVYNIVIGGIPGAIPPLIGWAIVENSLSLSIFSLFFIIFFWIPPHSWALALFKIKEYRKIKIPMLPVVKGRDKTINQMVFYSIFLFISSYTPYYFDLIGISYVLIVTILNGFFGFYIFKLFFDKEDKMNNKYEKKLFVFSIQYLFILLIWMIIEKVFLKFF